MKKYLVILFLLLATPCWAWTIKTARGEIEVKKGDILQQNSFFSGQIKDLEDVTFVNWNMARDIPHTIVFVNCKNIKLKGGNYKNVEIPEDFIIDGGLFIHSEEKEILGTKYFIVENKYNKIMTYEMDGDEILNETKTVEDTPDEKKYNCTSSFIDVPVIRRTLP